jgi:hypothetical protein
MRPIRPAKNLKNNHCLAENPATLKITHNPVNQPQHEVFSTAIKNILPENR